MEDAGESGILASTDDSATGVLRASPAHFGRASDSVVCDGDFDVFLRLRVEPVGACANGNVVVDDDLFRWMVLSSC